MFIEDDDVIENDEDPTMQALFENDELEPLEEETATQKRLRLKEDARKAFADKPSDTPDPDRPLWAKTTLYGAEAHFFWPGNHRVAICGEKMVRKGSGVRLGLCEKCSDRVRKHVAQFGPIRRIQREEWD